MPTRSVRHSQPSGWMMVANRGVMRGWVGKGGLIGKTYVLFTKCEIVLHCLLCILVKCFVLRLFCQCQKEVNKYQCLYEDMTLKSEIA